MKYKVGDKLRPNPVVINVDGVNFSGDDWCDSIHLYQVVTANSERNYYELIGLTNGRSQFRLDCLFVDKHYNKRDDKCGECKNGCRSDKGKCEFYEV